MASAPAGPRVEQQDLVRVGAGGEGALVGAEPDHCDGLVVAAQDAQRGRALEQRREQVAARLRRVVERHALTRQQQRAIQVILDEGACAQPLRVGRDCLLVRAAALLERDDARDDGEQEQCRDAGEHRAQAALGALVRGAARRLGRSRSLALSSGPWAVGPFQRGRQAGAAI